MTPQTRRIEAPEYNATIKHLRAFLSVARQRSFTRAATEMHLSQPSLTMIIRQLEDIAGGPLFDRTTRSVLLTPEGEHLFPTAERVIADFDSAIRNIKIASDERNSRISIAVVHSVATKVMPRVLKALLTQYPTARVQLREGNSADVRHWVDCNEVDIGFGSKDRDEADLDFRLLFRDQLGLVTHTNHPLLKRREPLRWADLDGFDFVGLTSDTATAPILDHIAELPESVTNPRYTVSTNPALWALIENGFGITTAPAMVFDHNSRSTLRFRALGAPIAWREVFVVRRRGRTLTRSAQTLLDLVTQETARIAAGHPLIEA